MIGPTVILLRMILNLSRFEFELSETHGGPKYIYLLDKYESVNYLILNIHK